MTSKRYPDPRKQIEAGYFWLSIGLAVSLVIVLFKPFGIFQFTTGIVMYGLFHLIAGKNALRGSSSNESFSDEWWLEDSASDQHEVENSESYDEIDWLLSEDAIESEETFSQEVIEDLNSDLNYETENDFGDEDIFAKSWRDPIYDQDENDDVEDPPELIAYRSDYAEWNDSAEDSKDY